MTQPRINKFNGDYAFLSNFYEHTIVFEGRTYRTSEHAYQAAKTIIEAEKILFERQKITPSYAKRMGQTVTMRSDWEDVKIPIMYAILKEKFLDSKLKTMLTNTQGSYLEEGNYWHDTFWGICRGKGTNHLGIILMEIRDELMGKI